MWNDGTAMVFVDFLLVVNACLALAFVALYVIRVRFERSLMGRLVAANGLAWLVVIIGGLAYRVGATDLVPWLYVPIGFGLTFVLTWWIRTLSRSGGDASRLQQTADGWTAEAWDMAARGRSAEAQLAFRHAAQLRNAADLGTVQDPS